MSAQFCWWRCIWPSLRAGWSSPPARQPCSAADGGHPEPQSVHLCVRQHGHGVRHPARVGVPLPLMSYGGTALITLLLGMGILMSVATHRQLNKS